MSEEQSPSTSSACSEPTALQTADSPSNTAPFRPAWKSASAITLFLLIAIGGLSFDLWTKHWAFHTLRQGGHQVVVPNVLEFQTMFNQGALFGIGDGKTPLFLAASCFALVLVSWMFIRSDAKRWLMHIALGGILAGAIGNMYDRINVTLRLFDTPNQPLYLIEVPSDQDGLLLREYPPTAPDAFELLISRERAEGLPRAVGSVRDFIKIPTKLWGDQDLWPWVFNIADMLLVGGVGILAIFLWRDGAEPQEASPTEAGPASDPSIARSTSTDSSS